MVLCCHHNRNSEVETRDERVSSMKEGLSQQRVEPGSIRCSNIQFIHSNLAKYSFRGEEELNQIAVG